MNIPFEVKARLTTQACYNPFFFEGKVIQYLVFYKDGKELGKTKWFGDSNNRTPEVYFPFDIPKKLKLDLTGKGAFYMKAHSEGYSRDSAYNIYIHADLVNFQHKGEKVHSDCDTYTSYIEHYSADIFCKRPSWGDADATPALHTLHFTAPLVSRSEKKELGKQVDALAEICKEKNIRIGAYELQQLMKHFDITLKK
jgi:hypothetical protein